MSKRMGYILISSGAFLIIWGLTIILKTSKTVNNKLQNLNDSKHEFDKKIEKDDNKVKGDNFEKFVVKKFDKKYFTIQEWRSDKYTDGIYAVSNHFPDLEVMFNFTISLPEK